MKKSRFTESQIVSILKKQESGVSVKDICRDCGTSDLTFINGSQNMEGWILISSKK